MNLKPITEAHIVSGTLQGLSEGIKFWEEGEVTEDMICRLQGTLADLSEKAARVAEYLVEVEEINVSERSHQ